MRSIGVLMVCGAIVVIGFVASGGSEKECPESMSTAKRTADGFVRALLVSDPDAAKRYTSRDAEPLRRNMPRTVWMRPGVAGVLRGARRSTVYDCSKGFLPLVGVSSDDPCFIYPVETIGGGWLRGKKTFEAGDFRVLLGCDSGDWRVKGTVRIT